MFKLVSSASTFIKDIHQSFPFPNRLSSQLSSLALAQLLQPQLEPMELMALDMAQESMEQLTMHQSPVRSFNKLEI